MTHPHEPLAELLASELTKWDDRTLDYAVSHLYGAWPENENLDRDAFIRELLWYIKHRDEREDEAAHLASVLADHVAKAVTEARARELRALADDTELLWNVARKAIEDELVEWRDSRMFVMRNNGLVIQESDGTPSDVIRMGPETAVRIALLALADSLAPEAPSEVCDCITLDGDHRPGRWHSFSCPAYRPAPSEVQR